MEGIRAGANIGIPRSFFREALGLALEAVIARKPGGDRNEPAGLAAPRRSTKGKPRPPKKSAWR